MKKFNVLLIDCYKKRREKLLKLLLSYNNVLVDTKQKIDKITFEQLDCDIVIVHSGNDPEGKSIENEEWNIGKAKVVLFSGSYSLNVARDPDGWLFYARAPYIEIEENLHMLLDEVLSL